MRRLPRARARRRNPLHVEQSRDRVRAHAGVISTGSRAVGSESSATPCYAGGLVWNRSLKVLDPDTGKRTMRPQPPAEWLTTEAPDLRIVDEDLRARVQARSHGRRMVLPGNRVGRRPQYLFSRLLRCGVCSGFYTIKSRHPRQPRATCVPKNRG